MPGVAGMTLPRWARSKSCQSDQDSAPQLVAWGSSAAGGDAFGSLTHRLGKERATMSWMNNIKPLRAAGSRPCSGSIGCGALIMEELPERCPKPVGVCHDGLCQLLLQPGDGVMMLFQVPRPVGESVR
jgi:hypothetical protein